MAFYASLLSGLALRSFRTASLRRRPVELRNYPAVRFIFYLGV